MPFQYKGERTMTWSVKERKKECEPDYLFQVFSEKEWEEYPFAGEEKLQWFRDARLGLFFPCGNFCRGRRRYRLAPSNA